MIVIDICTQQGPGRKKTGKGKMSLGIVCKSNANASMRANLMKLSVVDEAYL